MKLTFDSRTTRLGGVNLVAMVLLILSTNAEAQQPPYDVFPPADPPYYRVRYEASAQPGELIFPVNYTIWMPPGVKQLCGLIVHQHGCGEGSCKSGLTGAYDLHWQALAKRHDCALLAPSYEQPEKADCQMWCDPRNGSGAAFEKCLADLGAKSGHPELAKVPWALWGHSGGGHWAGGMVLLHPDRVAAAWLRSGVPLLKPDPARAGIKAHTLPDAALKVPVMCNLGTKEGVTVKDDRFGATPLGWALHGWCNPPPESNHARYVQVVTLLVAAGAKVAPTKELGHAQIDKLHCEPRLRAALCGAITS